MAMKMHVLNKAKEGEEVNYSPPTLSNSEHDNKLGVDGTVVNMSLVYDLYKWVVSKISLINNWFSLKS